MFNPKVKTTSSTSTVSFRNTEKSYYDMIISIQNQTINQSISITDTEGNNVTENPIVLTVPAKVILKDVQVGTITFSDSNSYNVIISYIVKTTVSGIPYIDIDYQSGFIYTQETGTPVTQKIISSGTLYPTFTLTPASGKKWIIRSLSVIWTAASTGSDYPQIQILPSISGSVDTSTGLFLFYDTISTTANDDYIIALSEYVESMTNNDINNLYYWQQNVNSKFEVYDSEELYIYIKGETNPATLYISYIEVNVG